MGTHTSPATAPPARQNRRRGQQLRFVAVPVLLLLLGLLIMLSPVVLSMVHNHAQQHTAGEYSTSLRQVEAGHLAAERAAARDWNATRDPRIAGDPWTIQPDLQSQRYQDYLGQLDLAPVMARLQVPGIGIDLPVYHGTEETTLARGVGHLFGTDLPVGGAGTHTVLTGHTGMSTATLFDNLTEVRVGDLMSVDTLGETLVYRTIRIQTVLPDETDSLHPVAGRELLTLITCTPYGQNSHRLLVTAERVSGEEAAPHPEQSRNRGLQDWMYLSIGSSALIVLLFLVCVMWSRSRHRERNRGIR